MLGKDERSSLFGPVISYKEETFCENVLRQFCQMDLHRFWKYFKKSLNSKFVVFKWTQNLKFGQFSDISTNPWFFCFSWNDFIFFCVTHFAEKVSRHFNPSLILYVFGAKTLSIMAFSITTFSLMGSFAKLCKIDT